MCTWTRVNKRLHGLERQTQKEIENTFLTFFCGVEGTGSLRSRLPGCLGGRVSRPCNPHRSFRARVLDDIGEAARLVPVSMERSAAARAAAADKNKTKKPSAKTRSLPRPSPRRSRRLLPARSRRIARQRKTSRLPRPRPRSLPRRPRARPPRPCRRPTERITS